MVRDVLCEVILSDIGELTVALDPGLTFRPDSFSVSGASITFSGESETHVIQAPEDIDVVDLSEVENLLLVEISKSGNRIETDLLKI